MTALGFHAIACRIVHAGASLIGCEPVPRQISHLLP